MDADLVSNVTYRIKTEAARQLFAVNRLTGAVSVLQALDFEDLAASNSTYTFEVEALDHGGVLPPGTATVIVRITVRPLRALISFKKLSFITPVSVAARETLFLRVLQVPVGDGLNLGEGGQFSSGLVPVIGLDLSKLVHSVYMLTLLAEAPLTLFQ